MATIDVRGFNAVGIETGFGSVTGVPAEGNRAREFRNTGGRAFDRKRRCAESESFAGSHPATEDKLVGRVSRVEKIVGYVSEISEIDWCRMAIDVRGFNAVGIETGFGSVTGGFAEGEKSR